MGIEVGKASAFDMNALDIRIRELVAYARERDGEDRTTLFRNLVDLFLTGKAPSREPTRAQLLDVIEALLPHVDSESRRTVAELLASQSNPPMDLVLRICHDRASLVEALLTKAPFDEDEVITLIQETGREHHQLIATRGDLSANVWIALARAAPAAPPFDSRSTLALWRDDLGAHEKTNGHKAASITALHPEKTASLRILRTDEDLIAERVSGGARMDDTHMVEAANDEPLVRPGKSQPMQESQSKAEPKTDARNTATTKAEADAETEIKPQHIQPAEDTAPEGYETTSSDDSTTPAARETENGETGADTPEDRGPLRDPGPGGWSWRSDRDGFITAISPYGCRLLGSIDAALGMGMLDLLGLNTKLGHPVTRAFQRRSTIHDAPIHMPDLGKSHQHWTLEAAPLFGTGGSFEGFEGRLTPVIATQQALMADHADDDPLFLDDPSPAPRRAAFSHDKDAIQKRILEHGQKPADRADNPALKTQTPALRTAAGEPPEQESPAPANPVSNVIGSVAAAVVREAVAETLKMPLSPAQEAARYTPMDTAPKAPAARQAEPAGTLRADMPAEIKATLELLEEALSRLNEAAANGHGTQMRLQSEIAMACVRALKDQLVRSGS
ncbi:hypothetical protein [Kordiimonas sp.]|uniref:hypothetical protein n=1 Tax=Kordiimonas sp. TaxID=1970157 RepID=UPI003A9376EC